VKTISLLRKALRRIKSGAPRMDFYKYKHGDCANFDKGTCRYFHFTNVNPKESACPHFKAKKKDGVEEK